MYRPAVLHVFVAPLAVEAAPILEIFAATTATRPVIVGDPNARMPVGGKRINAGSDRFSPWWLKWTVRRWSIRMVHVVASPNLVAAARWAREANLPLAVSLPEGYTPSNTDEAAAIVSAAMVAGTGEDLARLGVGANGRRVDLSRGEAERAAGARAADLDEHWTSLATTGSPAPERAPTQDTPTVSVVVVTHNRRALLTQLLEALNQQSYPAELIEICVVDNASSDGSDKVLNEWTQRLPLQVIKCPTHLAVAAARNLAVAQCKGEVIAFTDDDCRPSEHWIRNLTLGFSTGVGIVQGRTAPDQARRPVSALSRTQWVPAEAGLYETCNIAYLRSSLPGVGGDGPFDLDFADSVARIVGRRFARYPFGEDTELAWRVKTSGAASRFASDAVVLHHVFPPDVRHLLRRSFLAVAFPVLVARVPTLRTKLLTGGVLLGRRRAHWWLAVAGVVTSPLSPWALVATLPYLSSTIRPGERQRLDRIVALPVVVTRDLVESVALLYGSMRARCLVL